VKLSSLALCALLALAALGQPAAFARSHDPSASNQYGGPVYSGVPDLVTVGAFISAGGGPRTFSARTALNNVIGVQLVDPEIQTLQQQYGAAAVSSWLQTFDFVMRDAAVQTSAAGITLPLASPTHTGKALFTALLQDGTDSGSTFWTGTMLDKLVSHPIHVQMMRNVDLTFGANAGAGYHRITNQFMYDVAVQLGLGDDVKLSSYH